MSRRHIVSSQHQERLCLVTHGSGMKKDSSLPDVMDVTSSSPVCHLGSSRDLFLPILRYL